MMSKSTAFVLVGDGLAAAKAAQALRDQGFDGRILLLSGEGYLPYQRPALSKEFLAAKQSSLAQAYREAGQRLGLSEITVYDSGWYRQHDVDLRLGVPVVSVDPTAHSVTLADNNVVSYDKLLLATGSRSRRPPIPGADADGVH